MTVCRRSWNRRPWQARRVAQRAPGRVPLQHRLGGVVASPLARRPEIVLGLGVSEQIRALEHPRQPRSMADAFSGMTRWLVSFLLRRTCTRRTGCLFGTVDVVTVRSTASADLSIVQRSSSTAFRSTHTRKCHRSRSQQCVRLSGSRDSTLTARSPCRLSIVPMAP